LFGMKPRDGRGMKTSGCGNRMSRMARVKHSNDCILLSSREAPASKTIFPDTRLTTHTPKWCTNTPNRAPPYEMVHTHPKWHIPYEPPPSKHVPPTAHPAPQKVHQHPKQGPCP
ncbi:hypothetical protein BS17DRAFT_720823, partial [Gyrodon lividus]